VVAPVFGFEQGGGPNPIPGHAKSPTWWSGQKFVYEGITSCKCFGAPQGSACKDITEKDLSVHVGDLVGLKFAGVLVAISPLLGFLRLGRNSIILQNLLLKIL
jgi:hypothetical protein